MVSADHCAGGQARVYQEHATGKGRADAATAFRAAGSLQSTIEGCRTGGSQIL